MSGMAIRHRAAWNFALVSIALVLSQSAGCGRRGKPGDQARRTQAKMAPASLVSTVKVRRGAIERFIDITGNLKAKEDVLVSAKIMGRVIFLGADEGDRVRAGQQLVGLDTGELEARAEQARAAVRAAEARLAQLQAGRDLQRTQTKTEVELTRAQLESARAQLRQLESARKLTGAETDTGVAQAEARLESARQRLQALREGARQQERRQAEERVTAAKVRLDDAERTLRRQRQLFEKGAVPQAAVDQATTARDLAKADYEAARQQLSLVQEGPRTQEIRVAEEEVRQAESALLLAKASTERKTISDEQIAVARQQVAQAEANLRLAEAGKARDQVTDQEINAAVAAVDQAKANLQLVETQLREARIVSPVTGVVSSRLVDRGEIVAPGTPLFRVVALNTVYFEGVVSETEIQGLKPGAAVEVTVDSVPDRRFAGVVREVVPVADPSSRTFRVRISIAEGSGTLSPGGFARGRVRVASKKGVLIVPRQAILRRDSSRTVFVIEGDRVRLRRVSLGVENEHFVEITSGLKEGDLVAVGGHVSLRDGDRVVSAGRGD